MPAAPQAVFLSYASQDAEAVRRMADALRSTGVEVWFDQNELVGGDAWDAKIRGQIKACALLVPVISAATQARREGYFRIEWKLAGQRTHAIADGTPFLLPVVIDATRDGEALVPEEFRALLNFSFRSRGFDHGPARDAAARSHAERALTLDPELIEARYALGRWQRDNEAPEIAAETLRQVLARDPNHGGALYNLGWVYEDLDRVDEALALYERCAAQPGQVALARYVQFLLYFHRAQFEEAERSIRQSIAERPSANTQAALAQLLLTAKGDAEGAARTLASGATAARSEPRTIWITALVQLCQRAPEDVLKTLERFSDDYIQDNWFAGPKTYFTGRAHAMAGRMAAANLAWEKGLAVVDARLKENNDSRSLRLMRGELLALLGRPGEALREARTLEELSHGHRQSWVLSPLRIYALLGRADEAVPILTDVLARVRAHENTFWPLTPALLRVDPLWDKIRDDPRFQKLAASDQPASTSPVPVPASDP